jgi:hypothetical protein
MSYIHHPSHNLITQTHIALNFKMSSFYQVFLVLEYFAPKAMLAFVTPEDQSLSTFIEIADGVPIVTLLPMSYIHHPSHNLITQTHIALNFKMSSSPIIKALNVG